MSYDMASPVCRKGKEEEDILIIFYNGKLHPGALQN